MGSGGTGSRRNGVERGQREVRAAFGEFTDAAVPKECNLEVLE